jgi:hypothetical protein
MRRLIAVTLLAFTSFACAPAPQGPTAPLAREQVDAGQALDAVVARSSVEAFVRGYASASRDGGSALASVVVGPKLDAWVHWLDVQNAEFDGSIVGTPAIQGLSFVAEVDTGRAVGAEVGLSASVAFTFDPATGPAFDRTRSLDGPVTVVKIGPADWRVLDATRDGVPMSDGIQLFKSEQQTDGGITVRLDSLFMFAPSWQFNVIVENSTDHAVQLEPTGVALLRRTSGAVNRVEGALTGSLAVIPAHATVEGLMAYPTQDAAVGRTLAIAYRDGGAVLPFAFPLKGLVKVVPPPAPTTTAPLAGASS